MSALIRAAQTEDEPAVRQCVADAFEKYIERIGKPPAPMLLDYGVFIKEGRVRVAEHQNKICGVIVIYETSTRFYIDTVAVKSDFQGMGVGRALLEFAEGEAIRLGFTSIYLCTNVKMTENQIFYPRAGYVEYERRMEDGYDRVYYRKKLS
jgi:ribosomal protein S18 acetylase RimI-like enzyme